MFTCWNGFVDVVSIIACGNHLGFCLCRDSEDEEGDFDESVDASEEVLRNSNTWEADRSSSFKAKPGGLNPCSSSLSAPSDYRNLSANNK